MSDDVQDQHPSSPEAEISIDIEADLLDQDELSSLRTSAENLLREIAKCTITNIGWDICDAIWPAYKIRTTTTKPRLILLPLSRLGASQGYSGSHVMVGYFIDNDEAKPIFPSRPMIVKMLKVSPSYSEDKLEIERDNAEKVKTYIAYHKDSFAVPLHYDSLESHSLLWSPFSSNKWMLDAYQQSKGSRLALALDDLLSHLRISGGDEITRDIIKTIFRLLMPLHMGAGTASRFERSIADEYSWYLRNIEKEWGREWREKVWASSNGKRVFDFGQEWVNPFWVLEQLKKAAPMSLYCGAVHGDLHPRNVVISDNNSPHIIDFGWTTDNVHIAKDFALLECNLRFVVLSPNISFNVMLEMANWINFDASGPSLGVEYCDERVKLIELLRSIAKSHFPPETNWDEEYILPMFFIALGLLKHLREYDNQAAARLTVLSLSNYVSQHILST